MGVDRHLCGAQQTRGFDPMLFQYWPTTNGAGPTLKQHWVKSSCFLRDLSAFGYTRAVCVWLEQAAQCSVYFGVIYTRYIERRGRVTVNPNPDHFSIIKIGQIWAICMR